MKLSVAVVVLKVYSFVWWTVFILPSLEVKLVSMWVTSPSDSLHTNSNRPKISVEQNA
jgi:hypothetical protein